MPAPMPKLRLTRRASLLLPFVLAACGGGEQNFPPLRYTYLPPIRLNVAGVSVEQRYYPSGMAPDITAEDPVHPVAALRWMAQDRLQAVGTSGQAVFAINDASLTKVGDVITCALSVELEIYPTPGVRSGFARATVSRQHIGSVGDLPTTLYDLTRDAMNALNVEFEYQVHRNLQPWLATTTQPPVETQPLQTAPAAPPPGSPPGPANAAPTPLAPSPPVSTPPITPPPASPPPSAPPPPAAPPATPTLPMLPPGFTGH